MATIAEPNVVIDGLVFSLDAANSRCYSGSGITFNGLVSGTGGTLVNGVGFTSTNQGSFILDGTNDWINIASQVISDNSSVSLICWVKFNTVSSAYKPLIDAGNLGLGTRGYTLSIDNTNKFFIAVNAGYVSINNSVSSNTWYHLAGTAQFGSPYIINLYVNGILGAVSSSSTTNALTNTSSTTRLASNTIDGSLRFDGYISQAQLYSRALTAQEILQNYNATKMRYL